MSRVSPEVFGMLWNVSGGFPECFVGIDVWEID
jgi:hypothetical protein